MLNMIEIQINDQLLEVDLNDLKGNDEALIGILQQQQPISHELFLKFAFEYYKRGMHLEFEKFLLSGKAMGKSTGTSSGKYCLVLNTLAAYYVEQARVLQHDDGRLKSISGKERTYRDLLTQSSQLLNEAESIEKQNKFTLVLKANAVLLRETNPDELTKNQCISLYMAALKQDSQYVPALIGLANALYSKKDYKQALENYQKIMLLCGTTLDYDVRIPIGLCFYNLGMLQEAKLAFDRAAKTDPTNVNAIMLSNQVGLRQAQLTESKILRKKLEKEEKKILVQAFNQDPRNPLCALQMAESFVEKDLHKATVFAKTSLVHTKDSRLKAKGTGFLGRMAHIEGDYTGAMEKYESTLKIEPDCLDVLFGLAQVYIKQEKMDQAIQNLEKIRNKSPNDYDTLALLFFIYSENSKYQDQAQAVFESLKNVLNVKKDGNLGITDPELLAKVGKYFERRNPIIARKYYQDLLLILEQEGDNGSAELLNNLAVLFHLEAEEIKNYYSSTYRKNYLVKPDDFSDNVYNELLDSAEQHYQKALLALNSESETMEPVMVNALQTTIRYNVGRLFETRNEIEKATNIYKEILSLHPAYDECMLRLGCIEFDKGNYSEALDQFSNVLAIEPTNKKAWYMVGTLNVQRKNYRAARKAFEAVLQQDNHDIYSLTNLGYIHLALARGDANHDNRQVYFLRSIEFFCKAVKYSPQNVQACAGIGITFAETGDYKESVSILKQILEVGSGDPTFAMLAGHALVENGDYRGALSTYESLLGKGNGEDENVLQALTMCLYIHGKTNRDVDAMKKAMQYCQKTVHAFPTRSNIYNMAMIMQQIAHVISDQPLDKRTVPLLEHALSQIEASKKMFNYLLKYDNQQDKKQKRIEERAKYSSSLQRVIEKRIHETKTLQKQRLLRLEQIKKEIQEKERKQQELLLAKQREEREREEMLEQERKLLMEQVRLDNERSKQEVEKKRSKKGRQSANNSSSESEPEADDISKYLYLTSSKTKRRRVVQDDDDE